MVSASESCEAEDVVMEVAGSGTESDCAGGEQQQCTGGRKMENITSQ
jgi:hypothetical protein